MTDNITIALRRGDKSNVSESSRNFFELIEIPKKNHIFWNKKISISFEVLLIKNQIFKLMNFDKQYFEQVKNQIKNLLPNVLIEKVEDPLLSVDKLEIVEYKFDREGYYPILNYQNFSQDDPLTNKYDEILKIQGDSDLTLIQVIISETNSNWQEKTINLLDKDNNYSKDKNIIFDKISYPSFKTNIKALSTSAKNIYLLNSLFDVLEKNNSNKIIPTEKGMFQIDVVQKAEDRVKNKSNIILNSKELATIWNI